MDVQYSKDFVKSMSWLSGKILHSVISAIQEVKDVRSLEEISNCKKIETLHNTYRIRIGSLRAFFILHVHIDGEVVRFEYLVSREEAYNKANMDKLKNRDE